MADPRDLAARRARLPFALLYGLALPLLLAALLLRLLGRRRLLGLRAKLTGEGPACAPGAIMIHGVSLGEVMLMRPLVPVLETLFGAPCLITTSTETGWQAAERAFPGHQRRFFPFDAPWAVGRFLQRTRPSRVILLELELWPIFLLACAERRIPVHLLNARMTARSFLRYHRLRRLLAPVFAVPRPCLAQNQLWARRLTALGAREVQVSGSIKSDLVRVADAASLAAERLRLGLCGEQRPIFLIASTSEGEEEALLRSFQGWGQGWRLLICPRHPERGAEIQRLCAGLGLDALRSTASGWPLQPGAQQAIIIDEIGRLNDLYGLAELCAVGGGFGSGRHGQNMLEPAAAGRCTVVGWDTSNFPDAMNLLRGAGGVVAVSPTTLDGELRRLAGDADARARIGAAGRAAWLADRGSLGRITTILATETGPCTSSPPSACCSPSRP
jgi:3-deoxy-D-manno-octulosonic-acid transferase